MLDRGEMERELAAPLYCGKWAPRYRPGGAVQDGAAPASVRPFLTAAGSSRSPCKHLLPLVLGVRTAGGNPAFFPRRAITSGIALPRKR